MAAGLRSYVSPVAESIESGMIKRTVGIALCEKPLEHLTHVILIIERPQQLRDQLSG